MPPQAHVVILASFTLLLCLTSVSAQFLSIVIVTKTLLANPSSDVASAWPTVGTGIPYVPTPLPTCSISNPVCPQDIAVCPPECPDKCFLDVASSCCPNVGTPYCPESIPTATATVCAIHSYRGDECSDSCSMTMCTALWRKSSSIITLSSSSAVMTSVSTLTSSGASSPGAGVKSTLAPTSTLTTSSGEKMKAVGLGSWAMIAVMVAASFAINF